MEKNKDIFLTFFPDHVFRYIDPTNGRQPVSCAERNQKLNINGYESYFTVNGFKDFDKSPVAKKDNCTSLNAFFVDIDDRKDLEELEKIKGLLDPTFIIETKRGYHVYWCLDEVIYKEEVTAEEWETVVTNWEKIEQSIVIALDADPAVKDITRILRVPDTFYWKKTGNQYKTGTEGVFKIKGIYKKVANSYSMDEVEKVFPTVEKALTLDKKPTSDKAKERSQAEKKIFFENVDKEFPMEDRDSFKMLISGHPESLPDTNNRNNALLVTASLMRQAGWDKERALEQISKVGWHGIEKENGGMQEIMNTINSAFGSGYTFSHKNEIIAHNVTPEEDQRLQMAYSVVVKKNKEKDKLRFSNYEREIVAKYPHLKKNEVGVIFNYKEGVYKMMSDLEMEDIIFRSLDDDQLVNYRTVGNVKNKIACLLSIIPSFVLTNDGGYIINVKNGLLDIYTKELRDHTPDFVSLIQYPVVYDPEAKCPLWEKCVSEWMSGDEQVEKTKLIQEFSGYCLSSSMLYDKALFLVGDGGNGKSTFIDTIAMVVGKEATSHIDLEALYGQFGMAGLIGKRLNIIEEVSGNYYQSNKLKKLISGEKVTIDIKYKDQFTFRPQAKFVFSVNLLPRVDDVSTATERRICAVQFINNYRDNPNYELRSRIGLLSKELPGILNWMIKGANDLADNKKFIITKEQTHMLDEYREENSSVEGFLSECIRITPDKSKCITTPDLYTEYKEWNKSDGGRKSKSNMTFTKEVKAYGKKGNRFSFTPREHSGTESQFVGIEFTPQWIKISDPMNTSGLHNNYS